MAPTWEWTLREDSSERADRAISGAVSSGEGDWSGLRDGAAPPLSRSRIQSLMDEGKVRRGPEPVIASAKLVAGDTIRIEVPDPRPLELVPEDVPLEILREDEHLLIVNKPPGLTVHPSETQATGTLVHALLHHVKDLSGIGGVLRPGIVHRIDKDTSGALVVTKTDAAHAALSDTFSRHAIERQYWALCYGDLNLPLPPSPPPAITGATTAVTRDGELRIESALGRNPSDRKKMSMSVEAGRNAVTYARRIEAYGTPGNRPFACWIEARLETGRTHQVRVHLTGAGCSLLGDPAYGAPGPSQPKWKALPASIRDAVAKLPGQALHARVLGFDHPITGERIRVEAPPPEAFRLLHERLRGYR